MEDENAFEVILLCDDKMHKGLKLLSKFAAEEGLIKLTN